MEEELELRPTSDSITKGKTQLGAIKIKQLENQIKLYKEHEDQHIQKIKDIENELLLMKKKLQVSEQHNESNNTEEGEVYSFLHRKVGMKMLK